MRRDEQGRRGRKRGRGGREGEREGRGGRDGREGELAYPSDLDGLAQGGIYALLDLGCEE